MGRIVWLPGASRANPAADVNPHGGLLSFASKVRLGTSVRATTATRTLAAAQPLLGPLGVSRVTDVTRLDRLGLPVFTSIRPRGRLLCVHAGKGLDAEEARVGAVMEAVEFAVVELDSMAEPQVCAPLRDLVAGWPAGLVPDDFAPNHGAQVDPDAVHEAVACDLLGTPKPVWLPAELVRLPRPGGRTRSLFAWSTTGVASGNTLDETTLHALLEVLERDALAMNAARDESQWLAPASLPRPWAELAGRWLSEGVELIVHHVPNAFGLPCFQAHLHEPASFDVNLAGGSGLHLDARLALARAISEAAQSRLSTIHGGRDDITRFYAKYDEASYPTNRLAEERLLHTLSDRDREIAFADAPSLGAHAPASVLRRLRTQLARCGFPFVFRHHLSAAHPALARCGVHVVKVAVARCEVLKGHARRMGPRLRERVLALA